MDISRYADGAWIEIEVESSRELGTFRFKVQPISELVMLEAGRRNEGLVPLAVDAVVDWNLTLGDSPLPCTKENRETYLRRFGLYLVRAINGKKAEAIVDTKAAEAALALIAEKHGWAFTAEDALMVAAEFARPPRRVNLATAIVEFAAKPDNFLGN